MYEGVARTSRPWRLGDPVTPKAVRKALQHLGEAKAMHAARWDMIIAKIPHPPGQRAPVNSNGQATATSNPQQSPHNPARHSAHVHESTFPRFLDLPCELTTMIWKEAARQYFKSRRPLMDYSAGQGDWKQDLGRYSKYCPIKTVCKESRAAYIMVLGEFLPVWMYWAWGYSEPSDLEEGAPDRGPISEIFLRGNPFSFLRQSCPSTWSEGSFSGLKTMYLVPEPPVLAAFSNVPSCEPRMLHRRGFHYHQAQMVGEEHNKLEITTISPTEADLFETVLFFEGDTDDSEPGMWLECAHMKRKPNGDLAFIWASRPWRIPRSNIKSLFGYFEPHFKDLPNLERAVIVREIENLDFLINAYEDTSDSDDSDDSNDSSDSNDSVYDPYVEDWYFGGWDEPDGSNDSENSS